MKFSIIIPLYNKEDTIEKTLMSVLNQTLNNFELIIVNDGSTDNSVETVNSIKDKRIILLHQENKGVSEARNTGIKSANGDYISFLDADDEWLPNYLELMNSLINLYPSAGLYSSSYYWNSYGKRIAVNCNLFKEDEFVIVKNPFKLYEKYNLSTSAVIIPRYIFEEVELFATDCNYGEDHELWARISSRYLVSFYNKPLSVINRLDQESLSQLTNNAKKFYEIYINDQIFQNSWLEKNVISRSDIIVPLSDIIRYINKVRLDLALQLVKYGDKEGAKLILDDINLQDESTLSDEMLVRKKHVYSKLKYPQIILMISLKLNAFLLLMKNLIKGVLIKIYYKNKFIRR